jgi:hypothetical protein
MIGVAAVVLMPWNVGAWIQLARLRMAIELDCDDRVVHRHAKDPRSYGELLLAVRERALAGRQPALAFLRGESALARRITALVAPRSTVHPSTTGAMVVGLAGVVALLPAPSLRDVVGELREQAPAIVATPAARDASSRPTEPPPSIAMPTGARTPIRAQAFATRRSSPARYAFRSNSAIPPVSVTPSRPDAIVELPRASAAALPAAHGIVRAVGGRGGAAYARPVPGGAGGRVDSASAPRGGFYSATVKRVTPPDTIRQR